AGALGLFKNCRRLQSSVQLLRDPTDARKASEPGDGIGAGGNSWFGERGRTRDQFDQPGHDLLWNGFVAGESRAAPAGGFIARADAEPVAARDSKNRWRCLGASALHASSALERRTDRDDRRMR